EATTCTTTSVRAGSPPKATIAAARSPPRRRSRPRGPSRRRRSARCCALAPSARSAGVLRARSGRRVRGGEPALDVDAEVARLLAPAGAIGDSGHDAGLVDEVRQLVVARNERRVRQGLEALDVEAEVSRTLEELDP